MEPLNLVKRKNRPVAVVAPSTVVSPPVMAAATAPTVFPSGLLSSLYMNSMLNDQLFQRAAAAAQYGTAASLWTPANRFWQVMQQHNSAAQHYAAAAAAAAAAAVSTSSTSITTNTNTTSSSSLSSCTTAAISTATTTITTSSVADKDDKRSVSPANPCSNSSFVPRFVYIIVD